MKPSADEFVIHRSLSRYGLAVLSVGIALGVALFLEYFHFRAPAALLLLLAVAIASWYGGRGPGLTAAIVSTVTFYWYFVEPVRTIYIYWSDIPYFIVFMALAALVFWFGTLRRIEADLRQSRDALREQAGLLSPALRLAAIYGFFGALWILVSDRLLVYLVPDIQLVERLQTYKGWFFITVTSVMLWLLAKRFLSQVRAAEEALRRLNRELRAISNCNQTLLRATDEQSLLDTICRIACEEAGYGMAWVGYAEHDEARSVRPVAWTGAEAGYLATAGITWADTEPGRGPTGTAIRSGQTCCIQDFATDPRLAPWRESLLQRGFRSGIAVPLKDEEGHAFGSLTIHSAQPNSFTPEEIRLLEELAGDMAFGIVNMRSQAARKRAEEEVTLLSFALANVREAAFLIDDSGRFLYVNEEACRALDYTRAQLLGMGVADIDPDFPMERWPENWRDLREHRLRSFESRHRTRDGRIFPVEISANYFEHDGRAYHLALVRDITERKRAEEKLRQQEQALRQVLDFMPDLVAEFDSDRKRLYANRPALDYFGVSLEEWRNISDPYLFYHPEDRERITRDAYTGDETPHEFEARFRKSDGTYRWFLFRDNPVRDEEERVTRWYFAATDIEDRKRAEEERKSRVWFLESMDRINRAMQGTNDLEQVMGDAIDAMLSIFDSDRACLYYPCDPDAPSFEVVMERTRPGYPEARGVIPMTPDTARGFQIVRASSGVVTFGPGCDHPLIGDFTKRSGHKSSIGITLFPKTGKPWVLAMHQCSYPRVWTPDERKLLEEIARRLEDTLTSLLMFRSLRESEKALRQSEAYLAEAQRLSHTGSFASSVAPRQLIYWSEELFRIYGFDPQQGLPTREQTLQQIHPEDLARFKQNFDRAIQEKVDVEGEFRIVLPDGTVKYAHGTCHPVLDANGEAVELVGSTVDITERKRAEEALRRSEVYLADSQRLTQTGSFTYIPGGAVLYCSEESLRIWGFDRQQAIPNHEMVRQRIHPDDRGRVRERAEKALGTKTDWYDEFRIVLPDGTVKHIYAIHHPVFSASGELVEVAGTHVDITERKRAEEALREGETRFRIFVDHAGDSIFVEDLEQGIIVDVNRQACESLGYTRQELIGNTPAVFHLDADRAGMESTAERAAAGETVFDRHSHQRKDGSLFPVEVHTSLVSYGGRRFLLKVARDITDRVRAEEKLRQSEEELRQLVDVIPQQVFVFDADWSPVFANRREQDYTGLTSQEMQSKDAVARIFHPEDLKKLEDARERARSDGAPFEMEARIRGKNGGYRWFLIRDNSLRDEQGRVLRWYGTRTDIENQKRAEEARSQAQADLAHINRVNVLGELAASISHELNQPIAASILNASLALQWLERDPPDLKKVRQWTAQIIEMGTLASEIIDRLRALYKKEQPKREPLTINDVIGEMVVLLRGEATRHAVSVRADLADSLPIVLADRVQIQQVLMNLMLNGIEAMSDTGGVLTVKSQLKENGQIEISVNDTGPGLPPGNAGQIFDAFFTTKPQGSGMGLAISKSIVESHGGRIWANGNGGRGATFHFTLPAAPSEASLPRM